jgi:hypothetical protein
MIDDSIHILRNSAKNAATRWLTRRMRLAWAIYCTTRLKLTFCVNGVPVADLNVPVTVNG